SSPRSSGAGLRVGRVQAAARVHVDDGRPAALLHTGIGFHRLLASLGPKSVLGDQSGAWHSWHGAGTWRYAAYAATGGPGDRQSDTDAVLYYPRFSVAGAYYFSGRRPSLSISTARR